MKNFVLIWGKTQNENVLSGTIDALKGLTILRQI